MSKQLILTDKAQLERISIVVEEAAEVSQLCSKVVRYGWESSHPLTPTVTNRDNLTEEVADLLLAIYLLIQEGDIDQELVYEKMHEKTDKKNRFLFHNQIKR